ncbi:HEAT repeat domain-containing protein [Streptomyces sp. TRM43335]|uniref:HEAT repeat domain-containing protein n=1 Tax=Streptomyces taklimakanensis TaxID=2569853 RepID=A0A6G2BJH4_9ACTN|nr:HEAT repeat domain-containing protein [Streptomyces taklimakanensis]MTE22042.1 HEAT repeat domain-containing protein [Streptomyces taklimakanensis]
MFADSVDSDIAPSGTLLGLLQRGRGDGTLHALAAPRAEALAALSHCLRCDPRRDWQLEHRSLYYARLHRDLDAGLGEIEEHLFDPADLVDTEEERTGLALSVLGHLASYGDRGALLLLRRYAERGANWRWALDELAVRDDDAGLRSLGPAVLARFPHTPEGEAELAEAVRDAYEPRPWRLWAEDPDRPAQAERIERAREAGAFGRWGRQLRPAGPRPGWSVRAVLRWAQDGDSSSPDGADPAVPTGFPARDPLRREAAAARCLAAVAGPDDRTELLAAARSGPDAARAVALRHLAERGDPAALDLIEIAAVEAADPVGGSPGTVARSALAAFSRMRGAAALERARRWARREDALGDAAAALLACHGGPEDAGAVLAALRRTVRAGGLDAEALRPLVDGVARLAVHRAAPVLRHVYRETASSQLRGRTARALAATDPSFGAGFAVECLWDCEESTRELAARHAATGDTRVVERLRRLAADPAEEEGVQSAVRGRLGPGDSAVRRVR